MLQLITELLIWYRVTYLAFLYEFRHNIGLYPNFCGLFVLRKLAGDSDLRRTQRLFLIAM